MRAALKWPPIAAGLALALLIGPAAARAQEAPPSVAAAAAKQSCADCHQGRATTLKQTPHNALDSEGLASHAGAESACVACHGERGSRYTFPGGVSELAQEAGCQAVFAFSGDETPSVKAARCLVCHTKEHPAFASGRHAAAGMDCTSCHTICSQRGSGHWPLQRALTQYGSALQTEAASGVCWECHGDVVAQLDLNERHRLEEGIVECTSCHDPHRPQTREHLGGLKQEACGTCHTDKTGPFIYEHPASRVEGCTACHSPHGSPNRHMLTFQSVAELCFSCHGAVPSFHSRFTLETVCTNCHSSIHGSFISPYFLK